MPDVEPFVPTLRHWVEVFMHRSMRNFINYARESGLSMSQFGTLFYLHRLGTTGVTDLGDHLGITSAAASQLLEKLVKQELVLRSEDPNDRRVKQIVLTDKGLQVFRNSILAHQSWLVDLSKLLSADEKAQVTAALDILIDKASQLGQPIQPEC
jgi:DNA-binding MarR family transcriptional regulator